MLKKPLGVIPTPPPLVQEGLINSDMCSSTATGMKNSKLREKMIKGNWLSSRKFFVEGGGGGGGESIVMLFFLAED